MVASFAQIWRLLCSAGVGCRHRRGGVGRHDDAVALYGFTAFLRGETGSRRFVSAETLYLLIRPFSAGEASALDAARVAVVADNGGGAGGELSLPALVRQVARESVAAVGVPPLGWRAKNPTMTRTTTTPMMQIRVSKAASFTTPCRSHGRRSGILRVQWRRDQVRPQLTFLAAGRRPRRSNCLGC